MLNVFDADAGDFQTIANRLSGKAGAVLEAVEALLFNCCEQFTVFDNGRRSVAVICVDAENVNLKNCSIAGVRLPAVKECLDRHSGSPL